MNIAAVLSFFKKKNVTVKWGLLDRKHFVLFVDYLRID